jgi:hypothetical protein
METAADLFLAVVYLLLTPVGSLLFGLFALLVLGVVYLVKRPDG